MREVSEIVLVKERRRVKTTVVNKERNTVVVELNTETVVYRKRETQEKTANILVNRNLNPGWVH